MQREQLFTTTPPEVHVPVEARLETPETARSPLESYVLGDMPTDLRAVSDGRMSREKLTAKQAGLLAEVGPHIAMNLDPDTAKLTQLDLLFMFGGHIPAGNDMYRNAPPALLGLLKAQCDRFPTLGLREYMTYEMIVDFNSEEYARTGNMRVYADGEAGMHERDFYLGHHLAEPFVKAAAYQLHTLAEHPTQVDAAATLASAADDLRIFSDFMKTYGKLPRDAFAYFRQFLAGYADGTRNASGAFMPSVQLAELALVAPSEMYSVYLDESSRYFPDWAAPVIAEWRTRSEAGVNIEERLAAGTLTLGNTGQAALRTLLDHFIQFRMTHLGITKAQIPDAFSRLDGLHRGAIVRETTEQQILDPTYKGTAGFDVRNVLTNSVVRLNNLRERLGSLLLGDTQ